MMQNINMANQWCLRYLKKDKHTDTGTNVGTEKCTGRLTRIITMDIGTIIMGSTLIAKDVMTIYVNQIPQNKSLNFVLTLYNKRFILRREILGQ